MRAHIWSLILDICNLHMHTHTPSVRDWSLPGVYCREVRELSKMEKKFSSGWKVYPLCCSFIFLACVLVFPPFLPYLGPGLYNTGKYSSMPETIRSNNMMQYASPLHSIYKEIYECSYNIWNKSWFMDSGYTWKNKNSIKKKKLKQGPGTSAQPHRVCQILACLCSTAVAQLLHYTFKLLTDIHGTEMSCRVNFLLIKQLLLIMLTMPSENQKWLGQH